MRGIFVLGIVLGVVFPAPSLGEPLQPEHVAADARWLVHVNVDAIRSSEALETVFRRRVSEHPSVRSLEEGRWKLNVDFEAGVRGVTVYGQQRSQTRGVLLVYSDRGAGGASAALPDLLGQKMTPYHGHKLYTWSWNEDEPSTLALAFPRDDLAVWAGDAKQLKFALDVIDGRRPNLRVQEDLMGASSPAGTMFLVRAENATIGSDPDSTTLMGHVGSFAYAEGVREGRWFGRLTATTDTPQVNRHVKSVVDGVISAFWLLYGEDEGSEATQGDESTDLSVTVVENRIEIELHAPLAQLTERFGDFWQWMYEEGEGGRQAKRQPTENRKG